MFQTNKFFKDINVTISNSLTENILTFANELLSKLAPLNINKCTVVLDSVEPIKVTINNDCNRHITNILEYQSFLGIVRVEITEIADVEYSNIAIAYVSGSDKWINLISDIDTTFLKNMPDDIYINDQPGSSYFIISNDVVGQLWNIHTDASPIKAHLVITKCDEYFIWFLPNNQKHYCKVMHDKLYFFNVHIMHTVTVKQYLKTPRIHVVKDVLKK